MINNKLSERYKLELYIIRDNELEFALYDKEAETSQGTTKMIENKLNRQDKRIKELEQVIAHLQNKLAYNDQHSNFNKKFDGIEDWAKGGF